MKISLLLLFPFVILGMPGGFAQTSPKIPGMQQRAEVENRWIHQHFETPIPQWMRCANIDM